MTIAAAKMLLYKRGADIDWSSLNFDPDELKERDMLQDSVLQEIGHVLSSHFSGGGQLGANLFSNGTNICYDPNNLNVRVQPDYYIAFGVDEDSIRRRRLYLPWEAGKPPEFALELASDTTYRNDLRRKPGIYARIGIAEYWRFDPTGGRLYGEPLWGGTLVDGAYQPIPLTTEPDGVLKGYSTVLKIYLCWIEERNRLRFQDPDTGAYLSTLPEMHAALGAERSAHDRTQEELQAEQSAHDRTQTALQAEQSAHDRTQAELQSERAAREAAEARLRELQERLRGQQPEN